MRTLADAEQRMCRSKRRFQTSESAQRHNKGQRTYKCPFCEGWHLTNTKTFRVRR